MGSHVINYAFFQLEHQLSLACILSDSHKFQSLNRKSHCHGLVIGYHNQLGIDQNCRQLSISSLECSTIDRLFLFIDADSATINFHKLASLQVKASSNRYTFIHIRTFEDLTISVKLSRIDFTSSFKRLV